MSLEKKREEAIAYLRERRIYVLEDKFVPTPAASTDIRQTIARYQRAMRVKAGQQVFDVRVTKPQ